MLCYIDTSLPFAENLHCLWFAECTNVEYLLLLHKNPVNYYFADEQTGIERG
jgi:hypothetical protein